MCPDISAGLPKLPGNVEKPALQKAEMEWKAEKASSSSNVMPNVPWMSLQMASIPAPSIASVKPRM